MITFVLVIAAGAAIVLVAPVRVDLELDTGATPPRRPVQTETRWLWFSWRSGTAQRARSEQTPRPRPQSRSAPRPRSSQLLAALRTEGFVGRVRRLAVEVWRALAPRTVDGCVRLGLDDPASTGMLYALTRGAEWLPRTTAWNVQLEPEFSGPVFDGHARFAWVVRPGSVLWPIATFLVSPTTWRAALAALRAT